jgi:hypothetical protein
VSELYRFVADVVGVIYQNMIDTDNSNVRTLILTCELDLSKTPLFVSSRQIEYLSLRFMDNDNQQPEEEVNYTVSEKTFAGKTKGTLSLSYEMLQGDCTLDGALRLPKSVFEELFQLREKLSTIEITFAGDIKHREECKIYKLSHSYDWDGSQLDVLTFAYLVITKQ